MSSVSGRPTLSWIDLYASDTTIPSGYYLGQIADGPDGKTFRYALAGASALVVGNMIQSSAVDTQFNDMAVPAAVALGTIGNITITNGTTSVTANQFVGGTLEVSVTPGLGDEYTIVGHGTATSGSAWTVVLDRPLRTAWTTSTKVTVRRSPWSGVIQSPATTLTGTTAGAAIYAIPAATYGWLQTGGVGAALSDASSILVGSPVAVPSGTAGAVILGATNLKEVGQAMRAAATGKTIPIFFTLD